MTDITKCTGFNPDCPRRRTCWRYMAPANPYRQSLMAPPPDMTPTSCSMFIHRDIPSIDIPWCGRTLRVIVSDDWQDIEEVQIDAGTLEIEDVPGLEDWIMERLLLDRLDP